MRCMGTNETGASPVPAPTAEAGQRVVARPAQDGEAEAVRALLEAHGVVRASDGEPLASVVALFAGAIVGAAVAWPGTAPGTAWASVGVAPAWRGEGVAAFVGRALAQELGAIGVCHLEPPPVAVGAVPDGGGRRRRPLARV